MKIHEIIRNVPWRAVIFQILTPHTDKVLTFLPSNETSHEKLYIKAIQIALINLKA